MADFDLVKIDPSTLKADFEKAENRYRRCRQTFALEISKCRHPTCSPPRLYHAGLLGKPSCPMASTPTTWYRRVGLPAFSSAKVAR